MRNVAVGPFIEDNALVFLGKSRHLLVENWIHVKCISLALLLPENLHLVPSLVWPGGVRHLEHERNVNPISEGIIPEDVWGQVHVPRVHICTPLPHQLACISQFAALVAVPIYVAPAEVRLVLGRIHPEAAIVLYPLVKVLTQLCTHRHIQPRPLSEGELPDIVERFLRDEEVFSRPAALLAILVNVCPVLASTHQSRLILDIHSREFCDLAVVSLDV